MARHESGEPSRVLGWPVPPPLDVLLSPPACGDPVGLHDVAAGLWQVARDTAGQVDREVTVRLLLGACHLLGRPAADGPLDDGLVEVALAAASRACNALRERRPLDVEELLRVAWALAELDSVVQPADLTLQSPSAGHGGGR